MNSDDLKRAAKGATVTAASAAGDLGGRAQTIASDVADHGQALADQAAAKAGDMYDRAIDQLHDISDRLPNASDTYRAGQSAYVHSSKTVGRHVSRQPIEALLLAGAIGYLVGWATSRS